MKRRASPFNGFPKLRRRAAGGGGAPPAAPVLTLDSYVGDDVTLSNDRAASGFGKWSATSTPLAGGAIEAAPDFTQSFPIGIIELLDIAPSGPGTWWLNIVAKNAGGYSNVIVIEHTVAAPGWTFLEDWSAYANGNTFPQLDPAYSRTASSVITTIQTDAAAPAGLRCRLGSTTTQHRYISRDDMTAQIALRTTQKVQGLAQVRLLPLANARCCFGTIDGSNLNTGVMMFRGASTWSLAIQLAGDWSAGTNKWDMLTGIADNSLYWLRWEVDGLQIKAKIWLDGVGEPGPWTDIRTAGAAIPVFNAGLGTRVIGDSIDVLAFSTGIITDAPSF